MLYQLNFERKIFIARILVVDDSAVSRKLIKRTLANTCHEIVAEADSGENALLQYRAVSPDIVTMDMNMPGMSGLETSKMLLASNPDAKIIIITAHEQNDLVSLLPQFDIKHYIIKPVTEDKLNNEIDRIISQEESITPEQQEFIKSIELKPNDLISANHYLYTENLLCLVNEVENNTLILKLPNDLTHFNLLVGDPFVVGYQSSFICNLLGCLISEVHQNDNIVKLKINALWKTTSYKSLFEKLPMSVKVDMVSNDPDEKRLGIIKEMNINSITLATNSDFPEGSNIDLNIIVNGKEVLLKTKVNKKVKSLRYFEYNLEILFADNDIENSVKSYLQALKEKYIESI